MSTSIKSTAAFWNRVKDERAKLYAAQEGQGPAYPGRDVVLLMSVDNFDKGTQAGAMTEVHIEMAGQRIAEQTHRVATPEEIVEFKKRTKANAIDLQAREQARRMRQANVALMPMSPPSMPVQAQ